MHPLAALAPPRPENEAERLAALRRCGILDTPSDEDFDFLTEMAARVCDAPFAFVVLVDADRAWVKSAVGAPAGSERPRDDDYCAWTLLSSGGLHVSDLQQDPRTAGLLPTLEKGYRMYSGVNLHLGDGLHIGTLCVLDSRPRDLSPEQRRLLDRLGRQVMALIELRASRRELQSRIDVLDHLSRRDELTGLSNRRELMDSLEREFAQSVRHGGELSVLLIDVDHFKSINDRHGHPAGDAVLRQLGRALSLDFRRADTVGRYGGEEFMVVMPQTALGGAWTSAEAMRARIATMQFEGLPQAVTVSCGVAARDAATRNATGLIAAADRALYRAKRLGRNRVVQDEAAMSLDAQRP